MALFSGCCTSRPLVLTLSEVREFRSIEKGGVEMDVKFLSVSQTQTALIVVVN